jgi:cellulose synthase/poly-beta-1,6-N-acetylglucosamine synthase-like glycosyltransferase
MLFFEDVLKTTLLVCNVFLSVYSLYNIGIALFSLRKSRRQAFPEPRHRFAFLVAARNEEAVIGHLVESLQQQNYPNELFDVIVVPNNCCDRTRFVAEQAGARILLCDTPVRSKGDVLNFAFPELSMSGYQYDALCVVDADNLVHPDFLRAMNQALLSGSKIAQGYRDSKNPVDTGISGSYSIYFWLINRFMSGARHKAGLSAAIGGSGFMISTALIRELGDFKFVTMTEDMELNVFCYLAGTKVDFVPGAIVYDEQPLTFVQSWKQRQRWSGGMYQISEFYSHPVSKKLYRQQMMHGLDLVSLFRSVHMHVLWFASMFVMVFLKLIDVLEKQAPPAELWGLLFTSFVTSWLMMTGAAALIVILEQKLQPGIWRGILTFWFFVMSWLPINIICLFHKPKEWEQIHHERNIRIQDVT